MSRNDNAFELIKADGDGPESSGTIRGVELGARIRDPNAPFGPYLISEELATAANVALWLNQPLLLTGEAGVGKTSFAWALARKLGAEPLLEFQTKSTSIARDLFYSFDTLGRFHDANTGDPRAKEPENYIHYQALGEAIRSEATRVLLIDEVDKAPRDFPNDLLRELDSMEFVVPEVSPPQRFAAKIQHAIVITSNEERRLPAPFLRRCVYQHIPFPDEETLGRIVAAHMAADGLGSSWVAVAVRRFLEMRQIKGLAKPPATGELLSWTRVLLGCKVPEEAIATLPLSKLMGLQALLKTHEDLVRLKEVDR